MEFVSNSPNQWETKFISWYLITTFSCKGFIDTEYIITICLADSIIDVMTEVQK